MIQKIHILKTTAITDATSIKVGKYTIYTTWCCLLISTNMVWIIKHKSMIASKAYLIHFSKIILTKGIKKHASKRW